MRISADLTAGTPPEADYGAPPAISLRRVGKIVFLSDFMGPRADVIPRVAEAAGRGVSGALFQILDPAEEEFPFSGRTRFESMARELRHETDQAATLRAAYLDRLATRRDELAEIVRRAGWQLILHRTDESPRKGLLALYRALGGDG